MGQIIYYNVSIMAVHAESSSNTKHTVLIKSTLPHSNFTNKLEKLLVNKTIFMIQLMY